MQSAGNYFTAYRSLKLTRDAAACWLPNFTLKAGR